MSTPTATSSPPTSRRGIGAAVAVTAALVLWHVVALIRARADGPMDVDEADYLAGAAGATAHVQAGHLLGPAALWRSTVSGPLLPEVSIPFQLVLGRSLTAAVTSNLVFFVLVAIGTYLLARRWLSAPWAVLALAVTLTAPGITGFTDTFVFALAATATFTCAVAALVRSKGLQDVRWTVAFGIAAGTTVLARTIMISFVPALALAAAVAWAQHRPAGPRPADQQRHPLLATGVAIAVAVSWYAFSAAAVVRYLLDFGYGRDSHQYGGGWRTLEFWVSDVTNLAGRELYLPLAVVLLGGATAGACTLAARLGGDLGRRLLASEPLPAAAAVASGFVALLTSRNAGYGFTLPLVPTTVVLAITLASRARAGALRTVVAGALAAVLLLDIAMKVPAPGLEAHRVAWSAPWAALAVTDGRTNIARYLEEEAGRALGADNAPRPAEDGWSDAYRQVVRDLRAAPGGPPARTLIAVDGPLVGVNFFGATDELVTDPHVDRMRMAVFDGDGSSVAAAIDVLRAARRDGVEALVTGPAALWWSGEGPEQDTIEAAASEAGFRPTDRVSLPDGSTLRVWTATDGG